MSFSIRSVSVVLVVCSILIPAIVLSQDSGPDSTIPVEQTFIQLEELQYQQPQQQQQQQQHQQHQVQYDPNPPVSVHSRSSQSRTPPPRTDIPDDQPYQVDPPESTGGSEWRTKCSERCDERQMDVTGVGVHSVTTEYAEVRATVEYRRMIKNATIYQESETTPEDDRKLSELISSVQQAVSTKAANVVEYLQKEPIIAQRISKLRTAGLSLEPIYEYVNNRMLLSGYRGTNSITFRVEIPFAGEVVDGIVQRGVTRIDGISFVASPKEINQARHLAIQAAVEDAINQAMSALSGLHRMKQSVSVSRDKLQIIKMDIVGVTRPEAVTETQAMMPGRAMPAMAKFSSDVMATSPIEGDQKMVTATIIIKIRF